MLVCKVLYDNDNNDSNKLGGVIIVLEQGLKKVGPDRRMAVSRGNPMYN